MFPKPSSTIATPFVAAILWIWATGAGSAASRGETFTCLFPRAGKVILDTREPGAAITYRGRSYPATSGSYFYQSEDRISIAFNPAKTKWTLTILEEGVPQEETIRRCSKLENRR